MSSESAKHGAPKCIKVLSLVHGSRTWESGNYSRRRGRRLDPCGRNATSACPSDRMCPSDAATENTHLAALPTTPHNRFNWQCM